MEPMKVTYMYPFVKNGRVSVAIRYTPKFNGEQDAELAFAFCSPEDQFVRSKGRACAHGRLDSSQVLLMPIKPGERIKDKAMSILSEMIADGWAPAWTCNNDCGGVNKLHRVMCRNEG